MEPVNNKIDLSIIIVSFKSKKHLKVLLPSIFASQGIFWNTSALTNSPSGKGRIYTAEVIVVDNDSRDGTLELLEDQIKNLRLNIKVIRNTNNGFAAGNNLGIKHSFGKYILLLNPDTKLETGTLQAMLDFMESHTEVGISGCKIIKPDGSLDLACRRRFPNPWNSFKRLFLLRRQDYNYTNVDKNLSMEVDSVVGAFLLIRRTTMDTIGLLDE